jgi:hypothetical protein
MPVKAMRAPVRGKRSKAEMQQEFAEIQEQVESAREAADAKAEGAAGLHAAEVRQGAEGITVEAVVQKISGLGLEVGKALADVSEQLTQEVKVLATLREAVVLERKELEQLHKIDVAATALDQMVQDYAREKQRAEAEIGAQRGSARLPQKQFCLSRSDAASKQRRRRKGALPGCVLWTARQRVKLHYVDGNKSRANPIGALGTLARGMLHSAVPDRDSLGCLKGYARLVPRKTIENRRVG